MSKVALGQGRECGAQGRLLWGGGIGGGAMTRGPASVMPTISVGEGGKGEERWGKRQIWKGGRTLR